VNLYYFITYFISLHILFIGSLSTDAKTGLSKIDNGNIITDCNMSLDEALKGIVIPQKLKDNLELIDVEYYSMDSKAHKGQLLLAKDLSYEVKSIFEEIKNSKFPISKVIPIVKYHWSDSLSMLDNNSSCFNYRSVKGTKILSSHALGRGIDINPFLNPQFKRGKISPENAHYNPSIPGTLTESSIVVKAFKKRGWKWGGAWKSTKDYQHFEKK
jgi:hypothetical protein